MQEFVETVERLEGTLRASRYLDIRFGVNRFDYDDSGSQAGVNYDATLELDSYSPPEISAFL